MAKGLNRVTIIGNLGQDPELRYTGSGTAVTNLRIAVNMNYKDDSGDWVEKTEWVNAVCWAGLAETVNEHLQKGSRVYLEGPLQTRSWEDNDGNTRYTTEVKAREVKFLGGGNNGQQSAPSNSAPPSKRDGQQQNAGQQREDDTFEPDSDLPF